MGGGGMALHSKEGLRWELPIGQNLAIVPAIKLIIGAKHFDVCRDGKGIAAIGILIIGATTVM
jgi:hypothetical protein